MNPCPNCGTQIAPGAAVCECGELLRGDVTNVPAWETETVFGQRQAPFVKQSYLRLIVLTIGLAVLAFAWIAMRNRSSSPGANDVQSETTATQIQSPAVSDLIPPDDTIQPDAKTESQDGIFDFSSTPKPRNPSAKSSVAMST